MRDEPRFLPERAARRTQRPIFEMTTLVQLVVFRIGELRYALSLAAVERFIPAVEVNPLPNAPSVVLGAINIAGRVIPVLSLRRRFQLTDRDVSPADQFLIAHAARHIVALMVDEAQGVIDYRENEIIRSDQIVPGLEHIQGVVKLPDGLVLIHDLEKFLSLDETRVLDIAMSQEVSYGT
jgi:purine-binding chemotaxis protein CheW